LDAADIIIKMAEVYEKCSSYIDRGIVRHYETIEAGEVLRHRVAFKTFFKRDMDDRQPDKTAQYLFEWAEPPVGDPETAKHRVSAFWTENKKVMGLLHSQSGAAAMPSIDYAVASTAGISKGASVTVAAYLLPSLKQKMRTLLRFKELVREDDLNEGGEPDKGGAIIDGLRCFKLRGHTWNGSEEELWIDDEKFLLRRVRATIVVKPGVDEAQLAAIAKVDPKQAEEYRKFRLSQTEERRFYNQIEYFEAEVDTLKSIGKAAQREIFKFDPIVESDLLPSFSVL
jgi:hypothetical protein